MKTGPRTTRSSRVDGSSTAWPVMSDGIMSGVNCTRACGERQRLRQRAHEQRLAEAGHAFDQHVSRRDQRDQHLFDDRRLPDHRLTDGRAQRRRAGRRPRRWRPFQSVPCWEPCVLDEGAAPRGLEQRDRAAQFVRPRARAGMMNGGARARRASKPVSRASAAARSSGGQTRVAGHAPCAASSSARTQAACSESPPPWRSANWPVPRICSASDRRAASGGAASGPNRTAPRHRRSATSASAEHRPPARRAARSARAATDGRPPTGNARRRRAAARVAATNSQP